MKNIRNFKLRLNSFRKQLVNQIANVDKMLKEFNELGKEVFCPKCFSGNIRRMINKNTFCRNCGYDSRVSYNIGQRK